MESWLSQITDYLITQSWQIAVLVVLVAMVSFLLRNKSAHVRYLLWLVVLAKCLVPPLNSIPLTVLPQEQPHTSIEKPQTEDGVVVENQTPEVTLSEPVNAAPVNYEVLSSPVMTNTPVKYNLRVWLGVGWLAGAFVILCFYLLNALRTQIWLHSKRVELPLESRRDIDQFLSTHGIRRAPSIWLLTGISQPFVWGILRGSIYLPVALSNTRDHKRCLSLLGHELSHVLRYDALINAFQVVSQIIFWFHPFVWWANKRIRVEREKCCDEMTIARQETPPEDYGQAIVETLAAKHKQTRPVPSLAVAGQVKNIEERIKTMLKPGKKFHERPQLVAVVAMLLLAIMTVPTGFVLTASAKAEQESEEAGKLEYIDHSSGNIARPTSISLSPDGRHLYVAAFGSRCMAVFGRDQLTGYVRLQNKIPLRGAFAVCVSPNDRYVVCSDVESGPDYYAGTNTVTLFERDRSTGELTLLDSIKNEEDGIDSLDNVVDICFSPNSEFIYVIGRRSSAVTVFRISDNKKLMLIQSDKGKGQCFNGGRGIAMSPDGKYVYVVSVDAGTLTVFQRDAETGKISLKQVLKDEQGGVRSLGGVWDVTCSPDGRFIYTNAGRQQGEGHDDAVCTFERNADGTLSLVQELRINQSQIGLAGGSRLQSSPDGKYLYALGCNSDSMASFQRHLDTGSLTYLQTHSFKKLNNKYCYPGDLVISSDGNYVYVAGEGVGINGIILLRRLPWSEDDTAKTLYEAACSGERSLLESSMKKGADIDATGQGGYAALHWAAKQNQKQAATLLLDAGADVNARTGKNGWTPLHVATMLSNKEVSEILVARGVDLDAENHNNRRTPLIITQLNGDIDFAMFLLDSGAKLDSRDQGGQTPLHKAAKQGDIAFAEVLIKKGADVDIKDKSGWTPLWWATRFHQMEMIKWLISNGADVNAKMQGGQTPLHMACGIGMLDVVELLVANGADVNVKANKGRTPLSAAKKKPKIVEFLLNHGAKE